MWHTSSQSWLSGSSLSDYTSISTPVTFYCPFSQLIACTIEMAMLRVWSDVVTAADQRRVALLALLDMSDAFDCVDHDLLL